MNYGFYRRIKGFNRFRRFRRFRRFNRFMGLVQGVQWVQWVQVQWWGSEVHAARRGPWVAVMVRSEA
jgi:hypothetical protein